MPTIAMTGQRSSLRDVAYRSIRDAIVTLTLRPGEPVTEERLSSDLGISRPVLREAVQRLEGEGLLRREGNGRLRVAEMTATDAVQLYRLRKAIEQLLVADVIDHLTEDGLKQLRDDLERMAADVEVDQGFSFFDSGASFYATLYTLADNPPAKAIIERLRVRIDRYRWVSTTSKFRTKESLIEHKRLVAAIAARDVALAQNAVSDHVDEAMKSVLSNLESRLADLAKE